MFFIKPLLLVNDPYLGFGLLLSFYTVHDIYEKRLVNLMVIFILINGAFNAYLKFIFKVPLDNSLNNHCWWAFPSGHMQYGIVFWGMIWINNKYNQRLLSLLILLIFGSGAAMYYSNYHTVFEMLGAIPAAAIILLIYNYISQKTDLRTNPLLKLNIISIIFQLIILSILESPCTNYKFNWIWFNLFFNLGLLLSAFIYRNKVVDKIPLQIVQMLKSRKFYFISTLIAILFILSQKILFSVLSFEMSCLYGMFLPQILIVISNIESRLFIQHNKQ